MKKVMQIHFWASIKNTAGSVEKIILSFAKNCQKYTHVIACLEKNSCVYHYDNIPTFGFTEDYWKNKIQNNFLGLKAFTYSGLTNIIETERPEILHIHNRQELVDKLLSTLNYSPKVFVHYHKYFTEPVLPESADCLITVSQSVKDSIIEKTKTIKPIKVLYNPLFEELIKLNQPPLKENKIPNLIYGGGHGEHKGIKELLSSVEKIGDSFTLLLAGNGLQNILITNPKITNMGILPAKEFLHCMYESDIVVMPSHYEAFGLVALEAMYLKKILVCTKIGGLSEFVDEQCAVIVKPKNVDSLVAGLKKAIDMVNLKGQDFHRITGNAYQVAEKFLPEIITAQLEEIYQEFE